MDTCKRMWSKDEIENMAGGGAASGAIYRHLLNCSAYNDANHTYNIATYSSKSDAIDSAYVLANKNSIIGAVSAVVDETSGATAFDRLIVGVQEGPEGYFGIESGGIEPLVVYIKITKDTFGAL